MSLLGSPEDAGPFIQGVGATLELLSQLGMQNPALGSKHPINPLTRGTRAIPVPRCHLRTNCPRRLLWSTACHCGHAPKVIHCNPLFSIKFAGHSHSVAHSECRVRFRMFKAHPPTIPSLPLRTAAGSKPAGLKFNLHVASLGLVKTRVFRLRIFASFCANCAVFALFSLQFGFVSGLF